MRKCFLFFTFCFLLSGTMAQTAGHPVPSRSQLKWHEAELGVVFHYDLHVFDGKNTGRGITGLRRSQIIIFLIRNIWIPINGLLLQRMPEQNLPY